MTAPDVDPSTAADAVRRAEAEPDAGVVRGEVAAAAADEAGPFAAADFKDDRRPDHVAADAAGARAKQAKQLVMQQAPPMARLMATQTAKLRAKQKATKPKLHPRPHPRAPRAAREQSLAQLSQLKRQKQTPPAATTIFASAMT